MAVNPSEIKNEIDAALRSSPPAPPRSNTALSIRTILKRLVDWVVAQNYVPDHTWVGTALRFIRADGTPGDLVDLKGDRGLTGYKGWSAVLANVADGARIVQQVTDWTGGTGSKPVDLIGSYVSPTGFTPTLANATDIRGALGIVWKGAWQPNTPYAINDGVTNGGNSYRRLTPGTSGATFDPAQWEVVAQGGSVADGTISRTKLDSVLGDKVDSIAAAGYDLAPYPYAVIDNAGRVAFYVDANGRLCTPQVGDVSAAVVSNQVNANQPWPDESSYTWAIVDAAGRVAIGLDAAGSLVLKGQSLPAYLAPIVAAAVAGNVAGLQASIDLLNSYQFSWPDESGYVWGITDAAGRIAFGLNRAGVIYFKGLPINEYIANQIASISQYSAGSRNIFCSGDSLTEAQYPSVLASLFTDGRTVTNNGKGGDSSTQVAFRQGGKCVQLAVANNQIPASGPVVVTPADASIIQLNRNVTVYGNLMGVPGAFTRLSDGSYTFTRTTDGAAVATDKAVMFGANTGHDYDIHVIWAGRNNYNDTATVLADVDLMVAQAKAANKRFIVLGVLNGNYSGESIGGAGYTKIVGLNASLRQKYPRNFLDPRERLIRQYDPAKPQDVTDYANDVPPTSLRIDEIHLTLAGYTLVAQQIKEFITLNNW